MKLIKKILKIPLFILALLVVLIIRFIRPWLLVRFEGLFSTRIGHFAANTELYLCERDARINIPTQRYIDIFYITEPVSNQQLAIMWKRVLRIYPLWIVAPIIRINRLLRNGHYYEVGQNTQEALDVHNLLDRFPTHLNFTFEEETRGEEALQEMGLPKGAQFVCLNVRDSAYLTTHFPGTDFSYHNYRDSDIDNYLLAAMQLTENGYFVIRMGAKVNKAINSTNPKIIDYATNGMRNDFMDIYLGAKCEFCISTGTGWDAVPEMLRRPIVYVNMVPLGYIHTFSDKFLSITKRHLCKSSQDSLTLSEIFSRGVGFSTSAAEFESNGIDLIENTPEEIRDVVMEMAQRIEGNWSELPNDEALQKMFWKIFLHGASGPAGKASHGDIKSRFGATYLRNNRDFLEKK